MSRELSRRAFLTAAVGTGAIALVPRDLLRFAQAAHAAEVAPAAATSPATYYLAAGSERLATLRALCARVVPTERDAQTGKLTSPGADEAGAYVFIDRLLGAFSLPTAVADNPAIYLRGPYSGRNPFPDNATGQPSTNWPPDSFMTGNQVHYLPLSARQVLGWRAVLEGPDNALKNLPAGVSKAWAKQVLGGDSPAPPKGGLHRLYNQGLDAFDSYSQSTFGTPFAKASPTQQDLMVETAGNVVLGQFPIAPAEASALFPTLVINTFQGTYGLPEYRGRTSTPIWSDIGWDGDTQPLGSSIYDAKLRKPPRGQISNEGFGEHGVYEPVGYYREYRPVSTVDSTDTRGADLEQRDIAPLVAELRARGVIKDTRR